VEYAEEGEDTMIDVLRTCRVVKVSRAYGNSGEPLLVDVDLFVLEIQEDGLDAVRFSNFNDLIGSLAAGG
jgi:hypothetical protein